MGPLWDYEPPGRVVPEFPQSPYGRITFPRHDARFVRLRQTASHNNYWLIAELAVNAPPER